MRRRAALALTVLAAAAIGTPALAQSAFAQRPWGRVSFFANSWQSTAADGTKTTFSELATAFAYQLPDEDTNRVDYGVDVRYSAYAPGSRPNRTSLYEGFVGGRIGDGRVRVRAGHVWLTDLGSLGAVAGGHVEFAERRRAPEDGRIRFGVFSGLEPNVLDVGYADNVAKLGGYITYEGGSGSARRHTVGYVRVRNATVVERSAITTTNFVPLSRKVFVYQAAEYDLQAPAGQASSGLTYLFAMSRVILTDRVDVQGTYNKGRSVDVRGLSEDILAGRPVSQSAVDGLSYESLGGRLSVEVLKHVRVYGGYARDRNSRDADPTGRTLFGGYASNVVGSGIDVTASDSLVDRSSGGSYHSRYLSIGRQLGRRLYLTADYTTSLSIIRFSRSDGITVETRPHTVRYSGTATFNIGRLTSIMSTVERATGDDYHELRVLAGLNVRLR